MISIAKTRDGPIGDLRREHLPPIWLDADLLAVAAFFLEAVLAEIRRTSRGNAGRSELRVVPNRRNFRLQ